MNTIKTVTGIVCVAASVCCAGRCSGSGVAMEVKADAAKQAVAPDLKAEAKNAEIRIDVDAIKASIKDWQNERWRQSDIVKFRKANGKVQAGDLRVVANYADLQPIFDLMVADYVVYVNVLDSFADAKSAPEAMVELTKAISLSDVIKMAEDIEKAVENAKSLKSKASWRDSVPIGKDMVAILKIASSMTNATGILKSILEQAVAQ